MEEETLKNIISKTMLNAEEFVNYAYQGAMIRREKVHIQEFGCDIQRISKKGWK